MIVSIEVDFIHMVDGRHFQSEAHLVFARAFL